MEALVAVLKRLPTVCLAAGGILYAVAVAAVGDTVGDALWLAILYSPIVILLAILAHRLRVLSEREGKIASLDPLTGLVNSQSFMKTAGDSLTQDSDQWRPVTTVFIDCDDFKRVNDTWGHLEGDKLLRALAREMSAAIGPAGTVARMGGDEFAVLIRESNGANPVSVIEGLQSAVNELMRGNGWPVTLSIGVATFETRPDSADEMVRRADDLMYKVKRGDKNGAMYERVE